MPGGNRLVEETPVAFLCITRKLQSKPYEPLTSADIDRALSNQMSLRPPPYVTADTLYDFYHAIQGHCNIPLMDANATLELTTMPNFVSGSGVLPAPQTVAASTGGVSSAPILPNPVIGPSGASASSMGSVLSAPASAADYRVLQIKQNERHVSHRAARVCSYFATREGCRRGPSCPFLHVVPSGAASGSASVGGGAGGGLRM